MSIGEKIKRGEASLEQLDSLPEKMRTKFVEHEMTIALMIYFVAKMSSPLSNKMVERLNNVLNSDIQVSNYTRTRLLRFQVWHCPENR
jgi:hypothetical protein